MKTLAHSDNRVSIAERLKRVHPNNQPVWGQMNAHQMICHCSDAFRAALGEKHVSQASGLVQRTFVKWFALYVPLAWPKSIPTRPEVEQGAGGTPPVDFSRDRRDLLALLERFSNPETQFSGKRHAMFGEMSPAEWRRWGYLHVDHHLRQFGV